MWTPGAPRGRPPLRTPKHSAIQTAPTQILGVRTRMTGTGADGARRRRNTVHRKAPQLRGRPVPEAEVHAPPCARHVQIYPRGRRAVHALMGKAGPNVRKRVSTGDGRDVPYNWAVTIVQNAGTATGRLAQHARHVKNRADERIA